jgi:hypothetical protein
MLDILGYHVGETNPTPADTRGYILAYAFECYLPPLKDRFYYLEWGEPRTTKRLMKLANTLAALTRNAKQRNAMLYAKAIDDWESDLRHLYAQYYIGVFHFGWPSTDLFAELEESPFEITSPVSERLPQHSLA